MLQDAQGCRMTMGDTGRSAHLKTYTHPTKPLMNMIPDLHAMLGSATIVLKDQPTFTLHAVSEFKTT